MSAKKVSSKRVNTQTGTVNGPSSKKNFEVTDDLVVTDSQQIR